MTSKINQAQSAVEKLAGILKITAIDIECVGCKEVYPNFISKLVSRLQSSVQNFYVAPAEPEAKSSSQFQTQGKENRGYQARNGQLFNMTWEHKTKLDLASTIKGKQKEISRNLISGQKKSIEMSCMKGGEHWQSLRTPQTKRYRYSMSKTNEIDLAAEKKIQLISNRKEEFKTPLGMKGKDVKLNELSSAGKFVFGRSGSKWDKGENFRDVRLMDFYEGSEGSPANLLVEFSN